MIELIKANHITQ